MFSTKTPGVLGVGIKGINNSTSQRFLLLKVNAGTILAVCRSSGCIFENLSFIAEEALVVRPAPGNGTIYRVRVASM